MSNGTVRFSYDSKESIPQDTPLDLLAYVEGHSTYYKDYYAKGLPGSAVTALNAIDLTVIGDLEGWTERDLRKLHGVGDLSIRILLKAAELSGTTVIPNKWPWYADGNYNVRLPESFTEKINSGDLEVSQERFNEIISTLIEERLVVLDLVEEFERIKKKELQDQIDLLKKQLSRLEGSV